MNVEDQVYGLRQTGHFQVLARLDFATAQAFAEGCVKPALAYARQEGRREGLEEAVRVVEGEIGEHPEGEYIDRDEALSTLRALTRTPGRNRHPGQQED